MPTPDEHPPASHSHHGGSRESFPGYEVTDANISGIVIFMISLGISAAVIFVVCYGIGRVINTSITRHDGPLNKWNAAAAASLPITNKNMASDAQLEQEELAQMTQRFPTPRLQGDNGDQDTADLHAKEDLLLDHYTWVDQQKGIVRIPIARAMELLAQRGLPVMQGEPSETYMAGDADRTVAAPLTNGFARTGYEQEQLTTMPEQRALNGAPKETASNGPIR